MNVVILSSITGAIGARRLSEAFTSAGHSCVLQNPTTPIKLKDVPDVIVARVSPGSFDSTIHCLEKLQATYPYALLFSDPNAMRVSFSKLETFFAFKNASIATPKTWTNADEVSSIQSYPVLIKPIIGNRGKGIRLIQEPSELEKVLGTGEYVAQEYIEEAKNHDIRAFVIDDTVVAAMERTAHGDEIVANLSKGGTAVAVKLDKSAENMAVNACKSLDLTIGGVDLIQSKQGMVVLEVNPSPGFKVGDVCGVDIPALIVEYVENKVGAQQ